MLLAALAGEGLASLSDIAAAKSIEAGLVLRVLEDWSPEIRVFVFAMRVGAISRPGCAPSST